MIELRREPRGQPRAALVLLHGRGSDEHDLLPLLDILDPRSQLLGITLGAPLELPPGGRHWYRVPRVGYPEPESFRASLAELGGHLDRLGMPLILGGFSQGAVMSYAAGLGVGRPAPLGVIAMSGFIPTVPGFELSQHPGLPVFASHGTGDPVINVEFGRSARAKLQDLGYAVSWREVPGGHHVDPRLLAEIARWVSDLTRA